MRRGFPTRRALMMLAAVLLAGGGLAAHTWYARPLDVDWFFARVHWQELLADPERMSMQSPLPRWLDDSASRLTPLSPAAEDATVQRAQANLQTLRAYDCTSGNPAYTPMQRESCAVLEHVLQRQVDGDRWRLHTFPVNQVFGVQSSLPAFLAAQHGVRNRQDAEDYIARLHAVPGKIASLLQSLQQREARGIRPPRVLIDHVIAEMHRMIAPPPSRHLLYASFFDRLAKLPHGEIDADARRRLLAQAEAAIAQQVYPAYAALIAHFEAIRPHASSNHGAWSLPDGDDYYAWSVRTQTTTDLTPEQAHQIGIEEVARLSIDIDQRLRALGMSEGSTGERLQRMAMREDQRFADSDAGRKEILDTFRSIIEEARQRSAPYFDEIPDVPLEVRAVPRHRERTAPGAYYSAPSLDGSRPGIIYVNLRNTAELPRFALRTLAYHEGIPGHHLQTVLQQRNKELPAFRQALVFPAYSEGWALYAEQLAWEIGLQQDTLDDLGRLQAEMFRAARLVVDTGLHRKRWSREQAIAYLREKTGMPDSDATAEVERYLVYPGQALAFKVGMLRVVMVKEEMQEANGDGFSLREFHRSLLAGGAVPLSALEGR